MVRHWFPNSHGRLLYRSCFALQHAPSLFAATGFWFPPSGMILLAIGESAKWLENGLYVNRGFYMYTMIYVDLIAGMY